MKPVELEDCASRFNVREVEGNQLHFQWLLQGYSDTKLQLHIWFIPRYSVIYNDSYIITLIFWVLRTIVWLKKLHLRQSYPAIPPVSNENLPTDPLPWAWGMNLKRHLEVSLAEKPHRLQHTWNHLNKSVAGQQLNCCSCQPQPILPILS